MLDYIIAIPSYQRPDKQETLDLFCNMGVDKSHIYIFTQTEEDYRLYKSKYDNYANIVYKQADGVAGARNNILNELSECYNILMCDDDISGIGQFQNKKISDVRQAEELNPLFRVAKKCDCDLFGIYPIYNDFFMSDTISTRATVNTVLGFCKGTKLRFREAFKTKEDLELCARVLSSGRPVLRYNMFAPKAKHRTNKGGCRDIWKSDENEKTSILLEKTYPHLFKVKSNNPQEVRLVVRDRKIKGSILKNEHI